jgi:predicted acetyltransferase
MPHLARPDIRYKTSYLAAVREFQAEGPNRYSDIEVDDLAVHFEEYVQDLLDRVTVVRPGRVAETIFWLIGDDQLTYLGRLGLRHTLNDRLRSVGGHIGYEIRPSQRRKGYGRQVCALGLDEARRIGLERVLITCDEDNLGSRRIIEANGGVLNSAEIVHRPGVRVLRFWVDLTAS